MRSASEELERVEDIVERTNENEYLTKRPG
jgi:hypothetical protein